MKKLKRKVKLLGYIIFIILASFGVGITGAFLPTNRERYADREIRTELVEKREDENEIQLNDQEKG